MRAVSKLRVLVLCAAIGGTAPRAEAQALPPFEANTREAAIVDSSTEVLGQIMQIPAQGIPRNLLAGAEGLVLVPSVIKGGFVIGVERGRGVVLVRDASGGWQLPQFVTITGGSIGWQAGVQATDLVLVFRTKRSVEGLLTGKFTVGVDAAAAAGPIGREASAGTDAKLSAEIYSYSRSRGLFAGLSVNGAKIDLDRASTEAYYRPTMAVPPGQAAPVPASAMRLLQLVGQFTNDAATTVPPVGDVAIPAPVPVQPSVEEVRGQLAAASQRLSGLVNESWRAYLALPPAVYGGDAMPSRDELAQALARYQGLVGRPEYADLTSRAEFGETFTLLQQLTAALPAPALNLPPPPQP